MTREERSLFESNDIVMESLREMAMAQEPSERFHYVETAMEAFVNPSVQGALVQKLYKEVISKSSDIDFGKIPDSKGDLTRYAYYEPMSSAIEILNKLGYEAPSGKLTYLGVMNRLHDTMLTLKDDFVFGYKFNIEFIQTTYQVLVLALYEMINICIVEYTDYLKNVLSIDLKTRNTKTIQHRLVASYVTNFLSSVDKGEWGKVVKTFKQDASSLLGLGVVATKIAMPIVTKKLVFGMIIPFIVFMVTVRGLVYIFYNTAERLSNYAKIQADLLRKVMELDNNDSLSAVEKQKRLLTILVGISDVIDTKITKTEKKATADLKKANRENFSTPELSAVSSAITPQFDEGFELI